MRRLLTRRGWKNIKTVVNDQFELIQYGHRLPRKWNDMIVLHRHSLARDMRFRRVEISFAPWDSGDDARPQFCVHRQFQGGACDWGAIFISGGSQRANIGRFGDRWNMAFFVARNNAVQCQWNFERTFEFDGARH